MAEAALSKLNLPPRLLNFFAQYPPQLYSARFTGVQLPLTRKEAKEAAVARAATFGDQSAATPTADHDASEVLDRTPQTVESPIPSASSVAASSTPTTPSTPSSFPPNPFLPHKNFTTGRWMGAKIGLRRQAELVKLAKHHGLEELLPPGRKSSAFKLARTLEKGLRVKGTGEGQKVKGHKWERQLGATIEKRRVAMENMPELIRNWKQRGHGRGWKKYPK